jgi:hypothetical protein
MSDQSQYRLPQILTGEASTRAVAVNAVAMFNCGYSIGDLVSVSVVAMVSRAKFPRTALCRAAWVDAAGKPVCGVEGYSEPVDCGLVRPVAVTIDALSTESVKPTKKGKREAKVAGKLF